MDKLITTPDVTRLPNLERFDIDRCDSLEKIHSSTGRSENLVHLHITECRKLVLIPPITGSKKLETLLIKDIPQLLEKQPDKAEFDVQFSSVKPSLPHNIRHITSHKTLTNLSLRNCKLGDDMSFVVGEIPNLQQLDLAENNFSRLDFSMFNLPRLKYLKVSLCLKLLELWELPSSIAILRADYCHSFKSIGNILDCKWLWKVSLLGTSPVFQILKIMSEGNAIEDHCISLASPPNQLQMDFVDRVVKRGEIFTLQLPPNWYDDSCGFFICIYSNDFYPCYAITLKPEMGKDFQFEDGQESSVAPTPHKKKHTYVGYVSLKMLKRHTPAPWWNLAYNITSFSILVDDVAGDTTFGAKLVLRKSKGHAVRTTNVETDYSEFWDEQYGDRNTFTIQHDSNSSIKILWTPCGYN